MTESNRVLFNKEKKSQEGSSKQRIAFAIAGGLHSDIAPIHAFSDIVKTAHAFDENTPIVFCDELPSATSLRVEILINAARAVRAEKWIKDNGFFDLLKHSPYFKLDDQQRILDKLFNIKKNPSTDIDLRSEFSNIKQYNAIKELLKFEKVLLNKKIPYVGTDDEVNLVLTGTVKDSEQKRIASMCDNIIKKGIQQLAGKSGIVIVNTGVVHAHRLAVNLWLHFQNNKQTFEADIFAMKVFSDALQEETTIAVTEGFALTAPTDSTEVTQAYSTVPLQSFECKEDKGHYSNPELQKTIKKIFQFQQAPNQYFVPDWDEEKQKYLVAGLNGVIVQGPDKEKMVLIEIRPETLQKKEVRDKLGISQVRITFLNKCKERCDYLRTQGITVEKSEGTNQFLVTYPKNKRLIVEKVANDWASIVKEKDPSQQVASTMSIK